MDSRLRSTYDRQPPTGRPNSTMNTVLYALINTMLWGSVLAVAWPLLQR